MSDTETIMEESPVPDNHGRAIGVFVREDGEASRTKRDLASRLATMSDLGFGADTTTFGVVSGKEDGGLVAHRGILQDAEYVDWPALRGAVEADLGFTYAEVTEAYAPGRPTTKQRQLREKIDARLLALSRSGGNMEVLAKALALSEKTLYRALTRAREADVRPMVSTGVVRTKHVCFKCGEPGLLRKRRFSTSPTEWVGNVALCDDHYSAGFERRRGNLAYWEFRFRDNRDPLKDAVKIGGVKIGGALKRKQRFPLEYPDDASYQHFIEGRGTRV